MAEGDERRCRRCGATCPGAARACPRCGLHLPGDSPPPPAPAAEAAPEPARAITCDLCAASVPEARARVLPPAEMRVIAGNGYGRNVTLWAGMSPEERRSRFYQLALVNDTPWALCPSCYEKTRPFAVESREGRSEEELRAALEPLLDAIAAGGDPSAARGGGGAGLPPAGGRHEPLRRGGDVMGERGAAGARTGRRRSGYAVAMALAIAAVAVAGFVLCWLGR